MFQFISGQGAVIDAKSGTGETPLHQAVKVWRSQRTVHVLRRPGADLAARTWNGQTPLQIAVEDQSAGLTGSLLMLGARSDIRTIRWARLALPCRNGIPKVL